MKKTSDFILLVLGALLGGFFVYKGINKHFLSECKVFEPDSTIPLAYQQVITAFCQSGFTKIIGVIQVTAGLLLIIPKTRLLGAALLLPVITNIFLLHYFLDNRPEELWETGIPLAMNVLIVLLHWDRVKRIFG